jgi:hypothetical protein
VAAVLACSGKSTGPFTGGESHFLYRCVSSCDGELECISGVCTKPCIVGDSKCSGLANGALCTNDSVEPGAVAICDVACADDGDCSVLGSKHDCDLGFCRAKAQPLSGGGTGGVSGAAQGAQAGQSCATTLIASPEENYQYAGSLSVSSVFVKPDTELMLDWRGVTTDLRGRPVDLDTVDMVEVALWENTPEMFEQELNDDTLSNPIVIMAIMPTKGATRGSILSAEVPSGSLEPEIVLDYLNVANYPPENHVYSVMVATGSEYGKGTYMLAAFQLDPDSDNTTVNVTSSSTELDYSAKIASRPATYVPSGVGALTLDWSSMNVTAAGAEFIPSSITGLRVASYTQSPEELEGPYFNQLEEIAVEMYEAPVDAGTQIRLDLARTSDGKQFAGIDDTHTWLLALNCGACQNPAPWYLTVLKPCAGGP